jgi:hypothetical protein
VYFDAEEGNWDNGQWEMSIGVRLSDLIPVQKLMAQPPEWNGEGRPPVVPPQWRVVMRGMVEYAECNDPGNPYLPQAQALLSAGRGGE